MKRELDLYSLHRIGTPPVFPERLTTQSAAEVANAVGEHYEILGGDPSHTHSARGATQRLLASLVAAGELRTDFDAEAVTAQMDAIKGGEQ